MTSINRCSWGVKKKPGEIREEDEKRSKSCTRLLEGERESRAERERGERASPLASLSLSLSSCPPLLLDISLSRLSPTRSLLLSPPQGGSRPPAGEHDVVGGGEPDRQGVRALGDRYSRHAAHLLRHCRRVQVRQDHRPCWIKQCEPRSMSPTPRLARPKCSAHPLPVLSSSCWLL